MVKKKEEKSAIVHNLDEYWKHTNMSIDGMLYAFTGNKKTKKDK